ncbi:hypothetical protein MD484_g6903, partial [Candolleomyces efflorescens]
MSSPLSLTRKSSFVHTAPPAMVSSQPTPRTSLPAEDCNRPPPLVDVSDLVQPANEQNNDGRSRNLPTTTSLTPEDCDRPRPLGGDHPATDLTNDGRSPDLPSFDLPDPATEPMCFLFPYRRNTDVRLITNEGELIRAVEEYLTKFVTFNPVTA